jgi:hypothetical protein
MLKVSVEKIAADMDRGDGKEKYRAQLSLARESARVGKPGAEGERKELAKAILDAALASKGGERRDNRRRPLPPTPVHSAATRRELLRYASEVSGAEEVPGLIMCSSDLDIRDMARYALERTSGDEAVKALCDVATKTLGSDFRLGAIGALARRTGGGANEALAACSGDSDPRIRSAAAFAMAEHPEPGFDAAICKALEGTPGACNAARLRLATSVARSGAKSEAGKIYKAILAANPTACQKKAAENGLKEVGG